MAQPNTPLTLGSLFDGSWGFLLAGILAGVTPIWASEIEPFAIRVTTKRLPQVKHYGDVSSVSGAELPPVDIITFGSPCQDMSIAGKRSGLDGSRSRLFYEAIRIVKEMRCATNGEKPRFIIWENVPDAFSSNKGADFKAVLESVIGVAEPSAEVPAPDQKGWPDADYYLGDRWSVAYRVLDAQGWGVPQRRKRIYLVADFAGQSVPKVLFESEGVSGYSAAGSRAWQRAASDAEGGSGTAGGNGAVRGAGGIVLNDQGGACMDVSENVTETLRAQEHGHPPCIVEAAGFCTEHSANARSIGYEVERSPTLRAGVVPAAVFENHSQDTRYTGPLDTAPIRKCLQSCRGFRMNDKIAIYLRLSLADGDLKKGSKDESNSIENQQMLLHDYIGKQEDLFGEIVEYVDDGYTGTNFNRPAFQKMIVDLKQGDIKVIIVKDLSRLGRDYIGVGDYIEQIFPLMGVRFIAVNNSFQQRQPSY